MGAALVTLARHHRSIAAVWWFCFLGGPVWLAALIILRRPRRHP